MPSVTVTIADTPAGGVSIYTDFAPAVGKPLSLAQQAALEVINRTAREYGLPKQVSYVPDIHGLAAVVDAAMASAQE